MLELLKDLFTDPWSAAFSLSFIALIWGATRFATRKDDSKTIKWPTTSITVVAFFTVAFTGFHQWQKQLSPTAHHQPDRATKLTSPPLTNLPPHIVATLQKITPRPKPRLVALSKSLGKTHIIEPSTARFAGAYEVLVPGTPIDNTNDLLDTYCGLGSIRFTYGVPDTTTPFNGFPVSALKQRVKILAEDFQRIDTAYQEKISKISAIEEDDQSSSSVSEMSGEIAVARDKAIKDIQGYLAGAREMHTEMLMRLNLPYPTGTKSGLSIQGYCILMGGQIAGKATGISDLAAYLLKLSAKLPSPP